jgi:hypothetical protein
MDQFPWGENLRLPNRLAENEVLLPLSLAAIAVFFGYILTRRFSTAHSHYGR